MLGVSDSGDSDICKPILGAYMSVSAESDIRVPVLGVWLSVSAESDTFGPGDGGLGGLGLGGLGCGLDCHGRGYGCRIGVQRFDSTVDHFIDAAFDGDFHAVLFGGKRLKNGELAW